MGEAAAVGFGMILWLVEPLLGIKGVVVLPIIHRGKGRPRAKVSGERNIAMPVIKPP